MTKVKICGLTRVDDACRAAELGADFLGFIFVSPSPRHVDPEVVAEIRTQLPPSETSPKFVGVFRDASSDYIREIVRVAGLDLVQFHGTETDDDVGLLGLPVIKTFRVGDALPDTTAFPSSAWHLFDTYDDRRAGGTGRRFDWSLLSMYPREKPFFLSGGIDPENVAAAVSLVRPDGIDLASGVESVPGVKDHQKMARLFERVRRNA